MSPPNYQNVGFNKLKGSILSSELVSLPIDRLNYSIAASEKF